LPRPLPGPLLEASAVEAVAVPALRPAPVVVAGVQALQRLLAAAAAVWEEPPVAAPTWLPAMPALQRRPVRSAMAVHRFPSALAAIPAE
jgi:hypothetical protein